MLRGDATIGTQNLGITVSIDTDDDMVDIELSGPDNRWFGFGFGQFNMTSAYAIVVSSNYVREYKLHKTDPAGGSILTNQAIVKTHDDGLNAPQDIRTITLERARIGVTDDHYTFPDTATDIDIIWAFNSAAFQSYNYHGTKEEGARGSSILSLKQLVTTTTTTHDSSPTGIEEECNFIRKDGEPLATDTCMVSIDYGTSMMDSYIYECNGDYNMVAGKSFWCNGENCDIGDLIDDCDEKALLDGTVYQPELEETVFWNCKGRENCDKVRVKYSCCLPNCSGYCSCDRYEKSYMQNMCWNQPNGGVILKCDDDLLIIDLYKYGNCTQLLSSTPYNKDIHSDWTYWESGNCKDMTYVCSGDSRIYIAFSVLVVFLDFLCV